MYPKDYKTLAERKNEYLAYEGDEVITWCSGCGNYGIQNALERALVLEGVKPHETLFCYDIGCNGNGADKMGKSAVYSIHGLHGRVISLAAGAAIANPRIKVIASGGDGGTMSEGINHLIHAVRNDYPMMFILHNNENYGLTTGQASATTRMGHPMNGSPDGVLAEPMNCSEFVLGLKPSFVARTFSGDVEHMTDIFRAALNHKGFAFVEVMQVCTTYNRATPQEWYLEHCVPLKKEASTLEEAKKACADLYEKMNLGVFYRDSKRAPFMERLVSRKGLKTAPVEEVTKRNISNLTKLFG